MDKKKNRTKTIAALDTGQCVGYDDDLKKYIYLINF